MPLHHIIPRHEWKTRFGNLKGLNAKDNTIELTMEQHAHVHAHYYAEITHHEYDRIASLYIASLINKQEALSLSVVARNRARKGEKRSPEFCIFMSAVRKGMVFTPEHCRNISLSKIGMKHTQKWKRETSLRMMDKVRGPYKPETKPRKSRIISPEHRTHISEGLVRAWKLRTRKNTSINHSQVIEKKEKYR